jgi:GT2 family glycosyltransferase
MRIAFGGIWRDSAGGQVARYFSQVAAFRTHLTGDHYVRVIAVEGDSKDDTWGDLERTAARLQIPLELIKCDHGKPNYGSSELPDRLEGCQMVMHCVYDHVKPDDEIVVFVETDLIWDPHTIGTLVDVIDRRETDVVAPFVMVGPNFYDIWAYRKDGERFGPFPPYHKDLKPTGMTDVDSVGSCVICHGEVARTCRVAPDAPWDRSCLVGFCDTARSKGYRVSVMPEWKIRHP